MVGKLDIAIGCDADVTLRPIRTSRTIIVHQGVRSSEVIDVFVFDGQVVDPVDAFDTAGRLQRELLAI